MGVVSIVAGVVLCFLLSLAASGRTKGSVAERVLFWLAVVALLAGVGYGIYTFVS